MRAQTALFLLLTIDALLLLFFSSSLSLTYHGAKLLYAEDPTAMTRIIRASLALFGQNDVALRLPMILMNLVSALLLYGIAKPYAKNDRERLWLVAIFLMLPGIISASLLVDSAALTVLGLFGYLYAFQRFGHRADGLLLLLLWLSPSFMLLFFGLAVHAARVKDWRYFSLYGLLVLVALWLYGFNTGGLPENRFLDTIGLYAAVLSPFVFIYMVYVLYRRFVTKRTDRIWSIVASVFLLSIALSFRQRIGIEVFAPYLMAALPLGMQTFSRSYRIRLRPFRKRYRLLFTLAVGFLVLNAAAVFLNKAAYPYLESPSHYFAHKAHVAKELAQALKAQRIRCAKLDNERMQLRLRFYGIERCGEAYVSSREDADAIPVTIRYFHTAVAKYYVTKIPKERLRNPH
jgi:hypothetical protein